MKQFEQWKMGLSRGARGSIDAFIAAEATQGCNWNEPQIRRWLKLADDMNRNNWNWDDEVLQLYHVTERGLSAWRSVLDQEPTSQQAEKKPDAEEKPKEKMYKNHRKENTPKKKKHNEKPKTEKPEGEDKPKDKKPKKKNPKKNKTQELLR